MRIPGLGRRSLGIEPRRYWRCGETHRLRPHTLLCASNGSRRLRALSCQLATNALPTYHLAGLLTRDVRRGFISELTCVRVMEGPPIIGPFHGHMAFKPQNRHSTRLARRLVGSSAPSSSRPTQRGCGGWSGVPWGRWSRVFY